MKKQQTVKFRSVLVPDWMLLIRVRNLNLPQGTLGLEP